MPGQVAGKVVFITGATRGPGRGYAIRLAQESADIIAADLAAQVCAGCAPCPGAVVRDREKGRKP